MDALNSLVAQSGGAVLIALLLVCGGLGLGLIALARRTSRLERRLQGITRGADGRSLEDILEAQLDKVYDLAAEVGDLSARSVAIEALQRLAVQRIGLVRFNPFEDTGGNQSFALAMLDGRGEGFIVSSLHSRGSTRIYAKKVAGGVPEMALSSEEAQALAIATASSSAAPKRG